jgi:hypothetical protein
VPNPARPALPADPHHCPDAAAERTKEAATTHPTHTNPTRPTRAWHRRVSAGRLTPPAKRRAVSAARWLAVNIMLTGGMLLVLASPAYAAGSAPTLDGVISNLTNWIVGILAGLATLFLTIGGLRYLTAGGDPGQVEKAKIALKSAAIGYALAILAPLLVSILASVVGGS